MNTDETGDTFDYITIKYNSSGVQQWASAYDGPAGSHDRAFALRLDAAGNVYVTGASAGATSGLDYATVKYNSAGGQQWVARYNGPGNGFDTPIALELSDAGEVYVSGRSTNTAAGLDIATVKYSTLGAQLWVQHYNGPGNGDDQPHAMTRDAGGNIYVAGSSSAADGTSDYTTIKYAPDGTQLWALAYDGPGHLLDSATALAVDSGGRIYVAGQSWDANFDFATIKYSPPNHAPVALADAYSINQDTSLTVAAPGVLANDQDDDDDVLTAAPVALPAHGSLTLNADGSFAYTPVAGYVGSDSFTYRDYDGAAYSAAATVTITVTASGSVRLISNGVTGDGALAIHTDGYGSFQTILDPLGNEDTYDPPGAAGPGHPSFSSGLFLFVGTSQRELLSDSAVWQNSDLTLAGDPTRYFSADTSLNRNLTQAGNLSDTNGDGVNDTLQSAFTVTGQGVNLSFALTQAVSQPNAERAAYLRQDWTITNLGSAGTYRFVATVDGDLPWSGDPYYSDDWVGVGRTNGAWYVYEREPADPHLAVTLSSLTRPEAYYAGKTGMDPDGPGGDPAFDFGTSNEIWDAYGIPASWRNFAAGVGRNTIGVSGSQPAGSIDPYDAAIGLQFVLTLAPGASQTLTLVHSYGSTQPLLLPAPCIADVDGDGEVGLSDLAIVLAHFGTPNGATLSTGDLDGDGDVDLNDLAIVLAHFGAICP